MVKAETHQTPNYRGIEQINRLEVPRYTHQTYSSTEGLHQEPCPYNGRLMSHFGPNEGPMLFTPDDLDFDVICSLPATKEKSYRGVVKMKVERTGNNYNRILPS